MMMHAYQEIYLNNAQTLLGEAFDYAINVCGISGETFIKMFISSTLSERFENGETSIILGKSGIELVNEIIMETTGEENTINADDRFERSAEYWIGWVIAYFQWISGRSFRMIFKAFSFEELQNIYYPLHEANVLKFADIAENRIRMLFPETNLKRLRTAYGFSQTELAEKSGVGLRSIQMYEQRNKDINKANAENLYRMAKVLGCRMEDLIERGMENVS